LTLSQLWGVGVEEAVAVVVVAGEEAEEEVLQA
jgi:hypothetical protein